MLVKQEKLWKLFISTFTLSAFTFGGGYVIVTLMKERFVDRYHWIEEEEMLDMTAIAQSAPGPIAVNGAIVVGYKIAGLLGVLVSVIGTILPPFIILSLISFFYDAFASNIWVSTVLDGMQAGVAAVIAVASGNLIEVISNPNIFSADPYWELGWLAYPVTVIWIVAVTNAVNLIDGLDGLACGVSTISSMTMLVIALAMAEPQVAVLMAALAGACLGFLPYNMNPAKIFMGDTGSTFLGYVLGVVSIQGLFKYYMLISFVVPFLMLGLPIFDTCFAFVRRIAHGQSPMHADRSHIHHRLIDMGLSQKQAVAVLYVISAILGLSAVVLTTLSPVRAMLLLFALCVAGGVSARIFLHNNGGYKNGDEPHDNKGEHKP